MRHGHAVEELVEAGGGLAGRDAGRDNEDEEFVPSGLTFFNGFEKQSKVICDIS